MPEIQLFRNAETQREVAAGEVIFEEGDEGAHFFGVIAGTVEIERDGTVVETVEAGGIFGEVALLSEPNRSASARATSDGTLAVIDEAEFLRLVKINAFFAIEVMRFMAERLQRDG